MHLPLSGGCQCGATRYEIGARPLTVYACHCTDCHKQTGSAFALSMVVARDALRVTAGAPRTWNRVHESGRLIDCHFCPDCGTRLWHDPSRAPHLSIVKPGTLDDTRWLRPIGHIWTKSAQQWPGVPDGVIVYDAQPPDLAQLIDAWQAEHSSA